MKKLTVFVAPSTTDLNTLRELVAAIGAGNVELLEGAVSGREVVNTILRVKPYLFYFAGHANSKVMEVSNGLLDPDLLSSAMAQSRSVEVVFINACESIDEVSKIFRNVNTIFYGIGWAGSPRDDGAQTFGVTFFNMMKLTDGDVLKSYDLGVRALQKFHPDHRLPILLNGRVQRRQLLIALIITGLILGTSLTLAFFDLFLYHIR